MLGNLSKLPCGAIGAWWLIHWTTTSSTSASCYPANSAGWSKQNWGKEVPRWVWFSLLQTHACASPGIHQVRNYALHCKKIGVWEITHDWQIRSTTSKPNDITDIKVGLYSLSYKGVVSKHKEVFLVDYRQPFFHSMADLRKIFSRQVLDCLNGRTRSKKK